MTLCGSTPEDQLLASALDVLRADYLAEAPMRLAELWTEFARVQNGSLPARAQLRTLAHRLAGSGGAYGFPDVTTRARTVDQFCRNLGPAALTSAQLAELRVLIQGIADAFHEATSPE